MADALRPLSPGERAVWAARFAECHAAGTSVVVAVQVAARAVADLRALQARLAGADDEGLAPLSAAARAMLAEIVGEGRPC